MDPLTSGIDTHRMLCGARRDNVLSFAGSYRMVPHTCFEDIVLAPLATWMLLLLVAALWVPSYLRSSKKTSAYGNRRALHRYRFKSRHHTSGHLVGDSEASKETDDDIALENSKWPKTKLCLAVLYSLLLVAALLMNILELVRLYLAKREAGLLPFTLAGLVIVAILLHVPTARSQHRITALTLLLFWTLQVAFTGVKLRTLAVLEGPEPRIGSKYPASDQLIDVGVYIALYAIFFMVELYRTISP